MLASCGGIGVALQLNRGDGVGIIGLAGGGLLEMTRHVSHEPGSIHHIQPCNIGCECIILRRVIGFILRKGAELVHVAHFVGKYSNGLLAWLLFWARIASRSNDALFLNAWKLI